ncbi:hypothetical protein Tco_1327209 [Tanacetum coccineum]
MEPDISNMTLNEYLMYQGRHKGLERICTSSNSVAPVRNRILVYPDSDEEDEEYCSMPPLLLCFQTPQLCTTLNLIHHNNHSEVDIESMTLEKYARYELAMSQKPKKMEHEVPNRRDDVNDFKDYDQEDGEPPDLPTFSATDEFASNSKQVEENIEITKEKEEVPMKDVEMDENHDIDHSGSHYKGMEFKVSMTRFMWLSGNHFKTGLVGYHVDDDVGTICDDGCCSRKQTWNIA